MQKNNLDNIKSKCERKIQKKFLSLFALNRAM